MLWLWARWNMVRNKYLFFLFALLNSRWDWRVMTKRIGTSSFLRNSFFSIRTINRSFNLTSKKESLTKWYRCKSNDLDFIHSSECNISHTHTNTHTHTIFLQSSLQIENPTKWAKKHLKGTEKRQKWVGNVTPSLLSTPSEYETRKN